MAIKPVKNGWLVDIQPEGRIGKRVRKTLKTQAEARRFEAFVRSKASTDEPYNPQKKDSRLLLDLVELWHDHHGHTLKSSQDRLRSLRNIAKALGNPVAYKFTAHHWTKYRAKRLEHVKPVTVNHEQAYLKAMFSELGRLELWPHGNPLARVRKLRVDETEMAFLTEIQVRQLLSYFKRLSNRDCYFISLLCLSTGARWGEAESLRIENLRRDRVTYVGTKSSKNRTIPIDPRLAGQLMQRRRVGRLFGNAYQMFQDHIEATGISLPPGQLTHVLRHTFASHFMMNGGNILVLQRVLGHQSITMTMRYAHFAPDHLEQAATLNPVARLTLG